MLAEQEHYGDLMLRRYFIGELSEGGGDTELVAHLEDCTICRGRIDALVAEEREFQGEIAFEAFAAGVEAKLEAPARPSTTRQWIAPLSTVAAAAAVILVVALPGTGERTAGNRIKGGHEIVTYQPAVDFYVGGLGASRVATMREPLREGERISIAYQRGEFGYIAVLSVDEDGEVSTLYPETGESLPADGASGKTRMLPGSVAFTGRGLERILVVLTDDPLSVESLAEATRVARERAAGKLEAMGDLELGQLSSQFHTLVIKP